MMIQKICVLFQGKYREQVMYLTFGVLATIISIVTFIVCVNFFCLDPLLANIISWVISVCFAFVTNRRMVFRSTEQNALKQFFSFIAGRVFTLLLEEFVFILLLLVWHNTALIKLIGQTVVIITNYIISKFFIFQK